MWGNTPFSECKIFHVRPFPARSDAWARVICVVGAGGGLRGGMLRAKFHSFHCSVSFVLGEGSGHEALALTLTLRHTLGAGPGLEKETELLGRHLDSLASGRPGGGAAARPPLRLCLSGARAALGTRSGCVPRLPPALLCQASPLRKPGSVARARGVDQPVISGALSLMQLSL